jgi:hypothetical protein
MPDDPQNWIEGLPEDIRAHPSLEKFPMEKTDDKGEKFPTPMASIPIDVVKSFINQEKLVGREKIPLPPEGATDEDWAEVWNRLGRPETAEGYEIKKPEGLPEEIGYSEELVTEYKGACHKLGILPNQAQGLLNWFMAANTQQLQKLNQDGEAFKKEGEATLRKEWGKAYDEKVASAGTAFAFFAQKLGEEGDKQITELMEQTGLGDHPLLVRFFAQIGEMIGEDVITGKPRAGFTMTPEQAQAEIAKVYGDPEHAYNKKGHPEHQLAVQKMADLFAMGYPEEAPPAT